jgi:glucose 1-dehydrogenase
MSDFDFALKPDAKRLLDGRRALVTGADSGLGQGIAFELASHGAAVAINHVGDSSVADAMVSAIEEGGGRAIAVPMDVRDEAQVQASFATVRAAFGCVDLLVNNAGVEKAYPLVEMPLAEWQRVIDVNLTGAFLCAREAARGMLAEAAPGTIVNITSVHEQIPWQQYSHYCASKAGEKLFGQSIAHELAPHGIRVVNVAPGAIDTPINREVVGDEAARRAVESEIPLGRWGKVEDVSRVVAWVASEEAEYIVGSTVFVDGGMTLYPRFV